MRLRAERERLSLSQSELARIGGVSLSTQVAYEAGVRVPDVDYLARVMQHGADALYILTADAEAIRMQELEHMLTLLGHIEQWEQARGVVVSSEKKKDALRALYRRSLPNRNIDEDLVNVMLSLAS